MSCVSGMNASTPRKREIEMLRSVDKWDVKW